MALEQMKKELKDTGVFWGGVPALEGEQDGDKWIRNNFKLSESGRVVPEPAQRWAAELCQRALASGQQQASKIGSNSCSSVKPKVKVEGGTASATAGSKAARAASVKVKVESSTASASIESSATKAANVKVKVEGSTASASTESTATTAAKVKLEKECSAQPAARPMHVDLTVGDETRSKHEYSIGEGVKAFDGNAWVDATVCRVYKNAQVQVQLLASKLKLKVPLSKLKRSSGACSEAGGTAEDSQKPKGKKPGACSEAGGTAEDSQKPKGKKPQTGYSVFVAECRAKMKEKDAVLMEKVGAAEEGTSQSKHNNKRFGDLWKGVSEEEKASYKQSGLDDFEAQTGDRKGETKKSNAVQSKKKSSKTKNSSDGDDDFAASDSDSGSDFEDGGSKPKGKGKGKGKARESKKRKSDDVSEAVLEGDADDEDDEECDLSTSPVHGFNWHRVVLDEAHKIKARTSSTAKAIYAIRGERGSIFSIFGGAPTANAEG